MPEARSFTSNCDNQVHPDVNKMSPDGMNRKGEGGINGSLLSAGGLTF